MVFTGAANPTSMEAGRAYLKANRADMKGNRALPGASNRQAQESKSQTHDSARAYREVPGRGHRTPAGATLL